MASYPTTLEPSWVHTRQRTNPLASMPTMWQAHLDQPNIYHTSHCDLGQGGWRKWTAGAPDMYTKSRVSTVPSWYSRREDIIRQADHKERTWPWELTSKPTERAAFGGPRQEARPVPAGRQREPHGPPLGQVEVPQWGLYHPPRYDNPSRVEALPQLHPHQKHF